MPVAIAPTGFTGMAHADGEILAARAAEKFGIPFTLSTMSICSIEDVAENTSAPFWFQLYVMRDREFMENLIKRAKDAKCSALVLTADLQVLGQRHKDIKTTVRAAETDHRQFNQSGDQARMVHENAEHGTPHVPQYRRTRQKRRRFVFTFFVDGGTVRPALKLGRRGAD